MGRVGGLLVRDYQYPHGGHVPALRAGGVRGAEGLPGQGRQDPRVPHGRERAAYAIVQPGHQDGRASGGDVRGGRPESRSLERAFRAALRERGRVVYPPVVARPGRAGGREARPGVYVRGVRHAGRALFQGRFPALEGVHPARVRPRGAQRHGYHQGGW